MIFRWWLALRSRRNRIWLGAAGSALLAVALALLAKVANRFVADGAVPAVPRETLDDLLTVIASSMLAVATFSLGVMVSAFASTASTATPRATELVMGDPGTRRAIASFVAAFIYAIVAKIALGMGYYGAAGRFVLFLATLGVLAYLVVILVLWVKTLSTLGRISDTLERIRGVAREALLAEARDPYLGGVPAAAQAPQGTAVHPERVGVVTHVDMAAIQSAVAAAGCRAHLQVRPGDTVEPSRPMLVVHGDGHAGVDTAPLRDAVVIDWARTFDQDPRFGMIVLSEVAQRALSPAVNDPGTAIVVMNTMTALLVQRAQVQAEAQAETAAKGASAQAELRHDRVAVPAMDAAALVHDAYAPIARDGAGMCEVLERLIKAMATLASNGRGTVAAAARRQAAQALAHGVQALRLPEERDRLREVYRRTFGPSSD
ncbi:MAG: DUF2254 domain-containing protein [Rubrivivax sp.]|nr:DUF2254 domain-containing protein [Rubrivivax sp.]